MTEALKRRQMLKSSALALTWLGSQSLLGKPCDPTPVRQVGPFYPVETLANISDMTAENGGRARGRLLALEGRIQGADCKPLVGAKVEIWQADPDGRYKHPGQHGDQPLDPHFAYFGFTETDENGAYQFKTIIPGPYRAGNLTRAPHIHFTIKHSEYAPFVTEVYFAHDVELQRGDAVYQNMNQKERQAITRDLEKIKGQNWSKMQFDINLTA